MGFIAGLRDFFAGLDACFSYGSVRKWWAGQLGKSIFFGTIFLIIIISGLGFLFWQVGDLFTVFFDATWFAWLTGVFATAVWALAVYFSAGPLVMLFMSVFLSSWGNWEKLNSALPFEMQPSQKNGHSGCREKLRWQSRTADVAGYNRWQRAD
jgi:hypothetical protein